MPELYAENFSVNTATLAVVREFAKSQRLPAPSAVA
jgi:hypothetical protein